MITIDGIVFSLQRFGGISVYFLELLKYLEDGNYNFNLVLEQPIIQANTLMNESNHAICNSSRFMERYRNCRTPTGCSVFHSSYFRKPNKSNALTVVTVYDFVYERYMHGLKKWVHSTQKYSAIREAESIICISDSTKDDLIKYIGVRPSQKVYVTHLAASEAFQPIANDSNVKPFILFVGQRAGYKNFKLLLLSMSYLPELELHCIGGGAFKSDELKGVDEAVARRVRHLGFVNDSELNVLYNTAACLVYPSSYEGFGIPVIEAMKAGCPVVCVDCKAVLEVGGNALTVVYGDDPRVMADAILSTLTSNRLIIIKNGFKVSSSYSWEKTHRKTFDIYRNLGAYK